MNRTPFEKRRQRLGALYGAAGGLVFSVFTWGFDALSLAGSHVVLPYSKFIPGLIFCVAFSALVGWFTVRIDRAVVGLLLWTGLSVLLVGFVLWLPFSWSSWLIARLYPLYGSFLQYRPLVGASQVVIMGSIGLTILLGIAGLIENLLVDSAMEKQGNGGVVGMILMVAVLLGIGGFLMDNMLNPNFRDAASAMDTLIHFAVENKDVEVDPIVARQNHLRTMTELGVQVYTQPHRLIVLTYDPVTLTQIDYIVDFSGDLYSCTVVGNAPVYCGPLLTRNYQPVKRLISMCSQEIW